MEPARDVHIRLHYCAHALAFGGTQPLCLHLGGKGWTAFWSIRIVISSEWMPPSTLRW
jgi:hypothetical protein